MRHFVTLLAVPVLASSTLSAQSLRPLPVDGAVLQYEMSGTGPAVVLLHGWAHDLRSWHFLFPHLANNYTTIRLNRRGFASSTGTPDVSRDPVDLRDLLDSLGIQRAVILGHSQGANSALRFALTYPERVEGLVIFGSGPPDGLGVPCNGPDRFPPGHGRIARAQGMAAWVALWGGHPITDGFVAGEEGAAIAQAMIEAYDGRDLLQPQPSANATPAPAIGRLGEISIPTLVITGELEMPCFKIAGEVLAYTIPNAERVVIAGGGHSVHLQQPDRFNSAITRFLSMVYR